MDRMMRDYGRIRLRSILHRLIGEQNGLTMIEYVLIATLIIIVSIVVWRNFGDVLVRRIAFLCTAIAEKADECATQ